MAVAKLSVGAAPGVGGNGNDFALDIDVRRCRQHERIVWQRRMDVVAICREHYTIGGLCRFEVKLFGRFLQPQQIGSGLTIVETVVIDDTCLLEEQ